MTQEQIINCATWSALCIAALAAAGEWLHARRVARLSRLAFGPSGRPRAWTRLAPLLRVLALAGIVWSLVTLVSYNNLSRDRDRRAAVTRHLMVLLDVSPSMQLADAGENGGQRRAVRAAEVLASVLNRVPGDNVRFSAASFYTEARMLARECQDRELIVHFAADVPFFYTYKPGKTDLLKSLNQAGEMMRDWPRKSTTLLVISDGDSVSPTGLKPMPSSVSDVLFVGVGEAGRGTFIDGHLSRQDSATLSQLARRLGGRYFDSNVRQVPTDALRKLTTADTRSAKWQADRRLVALLVLGVSAGLLCLLPFLLEYLGSAWKAVAPRDSVRADAAGNGRKQGGRQNARATGGSGPGMLPGLAGGGQNARATGGSGPGMLPGLADGGQNARATVDPAFHPKPSLSMKATDLAEVAMPAARNPYQESEAST